VMTQDSDPKRINRTPHGGHLKEEIERGLAALVGKPLWDGGRESAMLWLQFGERLTRADVQLGRREVGEYTLHVSCPWRLVGPDGLVVASGDLFTPADPLADLEDFEWDAPGASWCDVRLQAFVAAIAAAPVAVSAVSADELGSLRLFLGEDFVLDVFPDSSPAPHIESEFWRLIQPGSGAAHFVVGSEGVARVPEA